MPHAPAIQEDLFELIESAHSADQSTTFLGNLSLPIHRWFRYSAGFSALWVRELILQEMANGRRVVFDPFAGSGTVLLEAEFCGTKGVGVEAHPFIFRVARAKLGWSQNCGDFLSHAKEIIEKARHIVGSTNSYPPLIRKCFPDETLKRLDMLRRAWETAADGSAVSELCWLALVAILRECSPVGTAQWQYVLPKKSKKTCKEPFEAYWAKIHLFAADMASARSQSRTNMAEIYEEDARQCLSLADSSVDLVITSPPYANNYDYADAARLEMTFLGEINGWGDLQGHVRRHLVRSCTQHAAGLRGTLDEILANDLLSPIRPDVFQICKRLEIEKTCHGGKKDYDLMVALYFSDLARVWKSLRRVCRPSALVCFVIGDSAPYGIHVPVEKWLGELALSAGFHCYRFEKIRDRNIKWKNRKHRTPLCEGRLWVDG